MFTKHPAKSVLRETIFSNERKINFGDCEINSGEFLRCPKSNHKIILESESQASPSVAPKSLTRAEGEMEFVPEEYSWVHREVLSAFSKDAPSSLGMMKKLLDDAETWSLEEWLKDNFAGKWKAYDAEIDPKAAERRKVVEKKA